MPQKTHDTSRHVEADTPPHVDVLIITAVKEEYDAVLRVDTGAWPRSTWTREPGPTGLEIASRTFQTARGGGRLRVLVTQAVDMGGEASTMAVTTLIRTYKPRCLTMCGVCAGRKGAVELGDVIIADLLWNYEVGKLERERTASGTSVQRFKGRNPSYPIKPLWKQRAESFQPDSASPWLLERPLPYAVQMEWVLERLLLGEDPAQHAQRGERCADYAKVLGLLREQRWLRKGPPPARLTKAGERHIRQRRGDHPDGLPGPKPFRVHVGPIATGNKVIKDPEVFEKLSETDYKVLGLEMEAAAIGALAHFHGLDYMLVVKGVMDFADPAKNDNFKHFAARASAECLLAFLRENPPTDSRAPLRDEPDAQARAQALATYKRARAEDPSIRRLDLRGLAGIAPGQHQTELDLLDFAVAPSLQNVTEEEGSREASLRLQLSNRNLEPARRRELEAQLGRLQRDRWNHHGSSTHGTFSFAKVLHHYPRFVIIGDPGAGKSVLTRLALLACMEEEPGHRARLLLTGEDRYDPDAGKAIMSLRELLPVRLTVGGLGGRVAQEGLSLEECIRQELSTHRAPPVLIDSVGELLEAGRLFLILDGFDEVPDRQREHVVDAVVAFGRQYPEVRLVATSRPNGYHPRIQGFTYTRLAPLDDRQQHDLVSRLHHLVETYRRGDEQAVERARRRTYALMRAIRTRQEWRELSSNPLLLTLCALTSVVEKGLPKHRVFLFENFLHTLLIQWREVVPPEAENLLLDAWSSVASTLVQQEKRQGVMEAYLLQLLAEALGARHMPAPLDAENALQLAIETGLIRKDEETVAFWHSTFAEFLAARALTHDVHRAVERLLEAKKLPRLVLQFAAARLDHVLNAHRQVDALMEGLLARDEQEEGRLLRSGLRAVSACMGDGVGFSPQLTQRVWRDWAELLENTPPSPPWSDFGRLTQHAPRPHLPVPLVTRLARIDDQEVEEVRLGLARLIAPAAGSAPRALEACKHWLEESRDDTVKLYGAYGLASAGIWTESVIDVLGRFAATSELSAGDVGRVVRQAAPEEHERLRALVRTRLASEEPGASPGEQSNEHTLRDRRLSAACLLAVGGGWNEEVARVLMLTLACRPSMHREGEAKAVVRACVHAAPVQSALIDWIGDASTLGGFAREIVGDMAPLLKDLPKAVLERTSRCEGRVREELESLLVSIAQERPTFTETLRHWLALAEDQQEHKQCAASVLRRLTPRDDRLHEALRRGMRLPDSLARVRWAHLAFGLTRELSDTALATLQECARSPEPAVRALVYDGTRMSRWELWQEPLDGWLACAADRSVPAAARLDAVNFLSGSSVAQAHVESLLRGLLETEDPAVRLGVLVQLPSLAQVDVHIMTLVAEEAARTGDEKAFRVLIRAPAIPPELFQAFLRALPEKRPSTSSKDALDPLSLWKHHLAELATKDPACVELLLDTLERPGLAGDTAEHMLRGLLPKHPAVLGALQKRLSQAAKDSSQGALLRLVSLGLWLEQTHHAVSKASEFIDLGRLSQWELGWLARNLDAHAPEASLRMWRLVLDGEDLKLVLQATVALLRDCPEKDATWLPSALSRVLGSSELQDRLDAGCLALRHGLLEEEARTALLDCIASPGQEYKSGWSSSWAFREIYQRAFALRESEDDALLRRHLFRWRRIDFMAMYVLCSYRPDMGLRRLAAWLEEKEEARFSSAVEILARRNDYREAVRALLVRRLASAPDRRLEHLLELAEECDLFSTEMAEQVLARYHAETPSFDDVELCLRSCLRKHPDLWALLRRQEPARRDVFALRLLDADPPITPDRVWFAVEHAFAHAEYQTPAERVLPDWCQPSQEEMPQEKSVEEPSLHELTRGWLREALAGQATPSELNAIQLFDDFAALGEVPPERRIEVLRLALAIDLDALESEGKGYSSPRYLQATIGLKLLELGDRDERIASMLEAALYECVALDNEQVFRLARALLSLQPADERLRRRLVRAVSHPVELSSLDRELEVLEQQVRLSPMELIEVLSARLEFQATAGSSETLAILDKLARLGCTREQRALLLRELISQCDSKLPVHTRLKLAGRAELSPSDAAKLMLSALPRPGRGVREVTQQWLNRFASQRTRTNDEKEWLRYADSRYLSLRLGALEKLSHVDDPCWLDQLLAELAGVPTDEHLALYRRARRDGDPLLDEEWAELMAWLTVEPDDGRLERLGKEWLTLGLWEAVAPEELSSLLKS